MKPGSLYFARFPFVSFAFIAICALMLPFTGSFPFIPQAFSEALSSCSWVLIAGGFFSMFSYMFLHNGFGHFAGNMFFVFMLGPSLEMALGHRLFAAFLILSGFSAALFHFLLGGTPFIPLVGASGVVFALISVWLVSAPKAVMFQVPVLKVPVRFFWLAILLFFVQINGVLFGPGPEGGDTTAYFVHIGGAISGIMLWIFCLAPLASARAISDLEAGSDRSADKESTDKR